MPPAHKISRACKRLLSKFWDALSGCCGMSDCLDEPLLGAKLSRGRSCNQTRRYNARKRSYFRGETSSPSPTRILNPFDDDALARGATNPSWTAPKNNAVPSVQDSAAELPLSTPFRHFNSKPFELDEQHTPLF